jgi:hypothetical protein
MNSNQQLEPKDNCEITIKEALNYSNINNQVNSNQQWQLNLYEIIQRSFLDNSSLGTCQEEFVFQQTKDLDFLI